jgi:DNA-binding XRE family transcriptional regulator
MTTTREIYAAWRRERRVAPGVDRFVQADPRVQAVMTQLEEDVAAATTRALAGLDAIVEVDSLWPLASELETAIFALPEGEPIGQAIGLLRRRAGLSRSALARSIGRDRGAVAAWESGRPCRFSPDEIARAAGAVGVNIGSLVMVVDRIREDHLAN